MEINYETIIKYLADIKPKEEKKTSQKNIYTYLKTIPSKFQELFCDRTYKYGITVHDSNNNNISFWTSLLTLIDSKFIVPFNEDEISIINNFKKDLIEKYPAKYSIPKNEINERLKLEPDYILLQYIVDLLDINIIIFDFKENNINALYKSYIMNPLKSTYLFAYNDSFWEPIMVNSTKLIIRDFSYNDTIIKKILSEDIKYYENKKEFLVNDNINVIIENEKKLLKKEETKSSNLFIKEEPVVLKTELTAAKLTRMTKDKLIEYANTLNINDDMSKMLKTKIIELITNKK
jgi:hypothetical protein